MHRRGLAAPFIGLVVLAHGALAATAARPVPAARCPDQPLSADYDPSDPESVRKNFRTAPRIVLAMGISRHEQLRALLARGENPNVCLLGGSVLSLSGASGDAEEVQILLDAGADPDRPADSVGGTPLLMALGLGQLEVARLLIAHGADVRATTDANMTSLIELASFSPTPGQRGEQVDLAQNLIDRGVAVDAQLRGPRTTALMMASIRGNEPLVQLLLQRGADPALEDNRGQTALSFALKKGHADVAQILSVSTSSAPSASVPQ